MRHIVRWERPWGAWACIVVRHANTATDAIEAARRSGRIEPDATRVVAELVPWGDDELLLGAEEVAA